VRRFHFWLLYTLVVVVSAVLLISFWVGTKGKVKLDTVFNPSRQVSVVLLGDVMLGRTVMTTSLDLGDPIYPFLKVADYLRGDKIVFANLENPIIKKCPRHTEGLIFCADPEMVEGLVFSGIDVVTLANNHTRNYGDVGLRETVEFLDANGIVHVGLGELKVKDVEGVRFGFLGFDHVGRGTGFFQEEFDLVSKSDSLVDVLIVGVHWGVEYTSEPTVNQRQWAEEMVSRGADVISGHHPHWVQSVEYLTGPEGSRVPVYYSLGNFVFDQMWSTPTRKGMVVELTFEDGVLVKEKRSRVFMEEWAQPMFVE